ncbi:hypothetical protein CsSME_00035135 [Camellia sinensis var. sinensis]
MTDHFHHRGGGFSTCRGRARHHVASENSAF